MNCNYRAESKNVEVLVDQIGQNKKNLFSLQNKSRTFFMMSQSILMKKGKDNIVGDILINYRELHDNCQIHYKFERAVDLFHRETYRRQ